MLVLVIPTVLIFVGRPPLHAGSPAATSADAPSATQIRARALRDIGFLSVTTAFALVLFAQVGFIVHLISFLDPVIGRASATTAIALLTAMAVIGRVLFSTVIDRLNQRLASALSFLSQAAALAVLINFRNEYALIAACGVFGFSVGNLITLPSLIVQREFDPKSFGVLVALQTAIAQVTYAFGPGVVGVLRDLSGSYTLPFYGCIALELTAAVLIMIRGRKAKIRRVGKGALAPCPPSILQYRCKWWARFALPTLQERSYTSSDASPSGRPNSNVFSVSDTSV